MDWDAPVFVLGMPRSGTTLVSQVIDSHPMVMMSPTMAFLQWNLQGLGWVENQKNDDLQVDPKVAYGKAKAAFLQVLLREYVEARLAREKTGDRPKLVGTKLMSWYPQSAEMIDAGFRAAKWVVVVRNPVDTYCSVSRQTWGHKGIQAWQDDWMRFYAAAIDAELGHKLFVRYEELVESIQPEVERIARFLGVPPAQEMEVPHKHKHDDHMDTKTNSTCRLGVDPISKAPVGRGERDLPPEICRRIKAGTECVLDKIR